MTDICIGICGKHAVNTTAAMHDAAGCNTCGVYVHALWERCPCCNGALVRNVYVVPDGTPEPVYP